MSHIQELVQLLQALSETDIHSLLYKVYKKLNAGYYVAITHGSREHGKDLLLYYNDGIATHTIGVVVKCGNLTGKTDGPVDDIRNRLYDTEQFKPSEIKENKQLREVVSQVHQSATAAVDLDILSKPIKLTKIFVVVVGTINSNARSRLQELNTVCKVPVEVKDLEWLASEISKDVDYYLPHIKKDTAISALISHYTDQIRSASRADGGAHSFIKPHFSEGENRQYADEYDEDASMKALLGRSHLDYGGFKRKVFSSDATTLLVGEPGTGKSTVARTVCIDYMTSYVMDNHDASNSAAGIAVFVRAVDVVDSIQSSIERQLESLGIDATTVSVDFVAIDGYDELTNDMRSRIVEQIEQYKHMYPAARTMLTSRRLSDYRADTVTGSRYELLPFELNQAVDYVKEHSADNRDVSKIVDGVSHLFAQMYVSPLSLSMLLKVVVESEEVPSSVADLFSEFVDYCLGKEASVKGVQYLFEYHTKRQFLEQYAYNCLVLERVNGRSVDQFESLIAEYCKRQGYLETEMRSLVEEMFQSGLLMNIGGRVEFVHKTFAEYLSARYISRHPSMLQDYQKLSDMFYDVQLSDVVFFVMGNVKETDLQLFEVIHSRQEKSVSTLGTRMNSPRLLMAAWQSPLAVKQWVIAKSMSVVSSYHEVLVNDVIQSGIDVSIAAIDRYIASQIEQSYRSLHLARAAKTVLQDKLSADVKDGIYEAALLHYAFRNVFTEQEIKEHAAIIKEYVDGPEMQARYLDRARIVAMCARVEESMSGDAVGKSYMRRVDKYIRRNPEAMRELFKSLSKKDDSAAVRRKFTLGLSEWLRKKPRRK